MWRAETALATCWGRPSSASGGYSQRRRTHTCELALDRCVSDALFEGGGGREHASCLRFRDAQGSHLPGLPLCAGVLTCLPLISHPLFPQPQKGLACPVCWWADLPASQLPPLPSHNHRKAYIEEQLARRMGRDVEAESEAARLAEEKRRRMEDPLLAALPEGLQKRQQVGCAGAGWEWSSWDGLALCCNALHCSALRCSVPPKLGLAGCCLLQVLWLLELAHVRASGCCHTAAAATSRRRPPRALSRPALPCTVLSPSEHCRAPPSCTNRTRSWSPIGWQASLRCR